MNKYLWAAIALVLPLMPMASNGTTAVPSATVRTGDAASAFARWLDQTPARRADVEAFEALLAREGVAGVLPTQEILVNDTDWDACRMDGPYTLAARHQWPHIVNTLRYLRDEIVPLIGQVQVVSGYRDLKLNRCAGGAKRSAHAEFYALDLAPVRAIARSELVAQVCANHAHTGAAYNAGLGIYEGTKFHIDTRSFRRWGPDYRSASSPCVRYEASVVKSGKKRGTPSAKTQVAQAKAIPRLRLAMLVD